MTTTQGPQPTSQHAPKMSRRKSTPSTIMALALLALSTTTTAQDSRQVGKRDLPARETLVARGVEDMARELGFSPKPTAAAELPQRRWGERIGEGELEKRQITENEPDTCGYVEGVATASLYCDTSSVCVADQVNKAVGCCPESSTNCNVWTTCLNADEASKYTTNDGYTMLCYQSQFPACVTHVYNDQFAGYTVYGCGKFPDRDSVYFLPTSQAALDSTSTPATTQTTTSTTPTTTPSTTEASKSNTAAIAGGVVGGIAALAALGFLAFYLLRKRKTTSTNPNSPPQPSTSPPAPGGGMEKPVGFYNGTPSPGPDGSMGVPPMKSPGYPPAPGSAAAGKGAAGLAGGVAGGIAGGLAAGAGAATATGTPTTFPPTSPYHAPQPHDSMQSTQPPMPGQSFNATPMAGYPPPISPPPPSGTGYSGSTYGAPPGEYGQQAGQYGQQQEQYGQQQQQYQHPGQQRQQAYGAAYAAPPQLGQQHAGYGAGWAPQPGQQGPPPAELPTERQKDMEPTELA